MSAAFFVEFKTVSFKIMVNVQAIAFIEGYAADTHPQTKLILINGKELVVEGTYSQTVKKARLES